MKIKSNNKTLLFSLLTVATVATAAAQAPQSFSTANLTAKVYLTAKNTNNRLTETTALHFSAKPQPTETEVAVFVDPSKTFQTMLGIGGALTDASAEVFYKLPKDKQQEILAAYYDKDKGIAYTLARTNIQSCDFSSDSYSYIKDNDVELKTFDISHDEKYRIPFIKEAIAAAGGKLTLFASPWSPPAWMKTNNDVLHGGKLKPEYQDSWANLFVKFIKAYEKEGIPIWGYTAQNEAMATQKWESCIFTAEEERDFVKDHLGPIMHKSGLAEKKLLIWDHNRDLIYQRASTVLEDPAAAKYVYGIAYHWYEAITSEGNGMNFEGERRVAQAFPDKPLLLTEGCAADFDPKLFNDWSFGEKYGQSMINDFNIGTVAWTDWNILLDEQGGPNHVGNFCMAPIHANTKTGELIYTNGYYYLGHFSKFIQPGAKRIACSPSRNSLLSTAYLNPDGKIAVVVMNQTDADIDYYLWIKGNAARTTSPAHSIATFVLPSQEGNSGRPGNPGRPWHDQPQQLPGKLECEYYNEGGEGFAYHDADSVNNGSGRLNPANGNYLNEFRMNEGVDISYTKTGDIDNTIYNKVPRDLNKFYVGWSNPGEWINYTINVTRTGTFRIGVLYTANGDGQISLDVDGKDATGPMKIISTHDDKDTVQWRQWHHWNKSNDIGTIHLTKGTHVIKLRIANGAMNLDYLEFKD